MNKLIISTLLLTSALLSYGQDTALAAQRAALIAERAQLQTILRNSYSEKAIRSRLLRAGLNGGAQRGLGGFGRGKMQEEEKIRGEKLRLTTSISGFTQQIRQIDTLVKNQRRIQNQRKSSAEALERQADASRIQVRARAKSIVESLSDLTKMYENEMLSSEEFVAAKKKLLGI